MSAVIVLKWPGKLMVLSTSTSFSRWGSSFWYVVTNNLNIGDNILPVCWYFSCARKNMVSSPFTFSPNLFDRRPNSLAKYFTHVVLFLARLNGCLYLSDSPVASSMIYFSSILRYWCSEMSSGVFWEWDSMIPGPISLYTFLAIFMSCGVFMYLLGGRALHGMSPPLVVNTHFRPIMG